MQGGKRQGDETCLETACRECREEVALELQGPDFMLLGSLPARKAKSDMALNAFVFLHASGTADVQPDPHEVAAAWWVPLSAVASRARVHTLFRSISTAQDIPRLLRCSLQTLGVRGLLFPCLSLPPPTISTTGSPSSPQPPLWGLTLGLTSDLLATGRIDCCGGYTPTNPLEVSRDGCVSCKTKLPHNVMAGVPWMVVGGWSVWIGRHAARGDVEIGGIPWFVATILTRVVLLLLSARPHARTRMARASTGAKFRIRQLSRRADALAKGAPLILCVAPWRTSPVRHEICTLAKACFCTC
jgi:ADP-ribose pyrophosphatase YjhB (NUDIX family)